MPVLGVDDDRAGPLRRLDRVVDPRDDLERAGDRQATRRIGEVVLDVDDDEGRPGVVPLHGSDHIAPPVTSSAGLGARPGAASIAAAPLTGGPSRTAYGRPGRSGGERAERSDRPSPRGSAGRRGGVGTVVRRPTARGGRRRPRRGSAPRGASSREARGPRRRRGLEPPDFSASVFSMPSNGATKIWLVFRIHETRSLPSRASRSSSTIRRMIRTWTIPNRTITTRPMISPALGVRVTRRSTTESLGYVGSSVVVSRLFRHRSWRQHCLP